MDRFLLSSHIAKVQIGGMGEWLKPAVLKTAVRGTVPGVRIPLPPFLAAFTLASTFAKESDLVQLVR